MRQFKQVASRLLQSVAHRTEVSKNLALRRPARRVLMLHGVGGPDLPADDFKAGLLWVSRRFRIVPLSVMMDDIAAGKPPSGGSEVAITFDDGLRNQGQIAYPILRDLGIPATIFVVPGLTESGQWLWNHEARARLRRLSDDERREVAESVGSDRSQIEDLICWMKLQPIERRMDIEQSIRDATPGFQPSSAEREACDLMSWEEVSRLDPDQITIGSHTVTHPILPTLSDGLLHHEVAGSRAMLERKLEREVDLFCYPNGSTDARVRDAVSRCYRAAVTTEEGVVPSQPDLYAIPRIAAAARVSLLSWRMYRPNA